MNDIVIRVENLSKRNRIGLKEAQHETLMSAAVSWLKSPVANFRRLRKLNTFEEDGEAEDVIWALRDISFEVKQGEVVGVIGRNGAGKTTLLKVLSRITEPTSGRAVVQGRVASLLEVGTGFHPELTGRENVYLNGTVLGMSKQEVDRKFDEIVAFSGVEKFIDTPVKWYSSGMQVRLAFAVAAHLEPEILLIDEVLAVGDAAFQRKCLGKMGDVTREGRTVLFVSHNMGAIATLCPEAILIDGGRLVSKGATEQVISRYLKANDEQLGISLADRRDRRGDGRLRFEEVLVFNALGEVVNAVMSGEDVTIGLRFSMDDGCVLHNPTIRIRVKDQYGNHLFTCGNVFVGQRFETISGTGILCCHIPRLPLVEGEYILDVACAVDLYTYIDAVDHAARIKVDKGDFFGTSYTYHRPSLYVDHGWELTQASPVSLRDSYLGEAP